jgi:Ion channel
MNHANQISVTAALLIGLATTFFTIIVHAFVLNTIVVAIHRHVLRGRAGVFLLDVAFVMGAAILALAGHFVEIALWALSFVLCGEFSNFATALYYSAASYTTLGDNTIVISARWRLLAPLEAADGMLLFGITTGMIFAVIHRMVQVRLALHDELDSAPTTHQRELP